MDQTLVFLCQKSRRHSNEITSTEVPNKGGVCSNRRFSTNISLYSTLCLDSLAMLARWLPSTSSTGFYYAMASSVCTNRNATLGWHRRYLIIYSNLSTKFLSTPKRKQPVTQQRALPKDRVAASATQRMSFAGSNLIRSISLSIDYNGCHTGSFSKNIDKDAAVVR